MYLSIYLSTYLPIYLSTYLPIYLSTYLSIDLSIDLPIYRSIDLSFYLSIFLSTYLSIYLPIFLSIYLSISLSLSLALSLSVCPSVYLSTCLSASLKTWLFYETSSFFQVDNIKNAALLRDFLIFWSWPHQKRSNSARLPDFLKLTTSKNEAILRDSFHFLNLTHWQQSKTKQFCETSSIFELDNIKSEAILWDFLQKWKVDCRADGLVPMRFAIFPVHLSKLLRLPRKSDARSYEVLCLSREIISANLKIWCSKMQPLSGNQRPDLRTAPMKMSLVLRLPRKMHLCRSSSNAPRLPSFLAMRQNPHVLLTFEKVRNPLRLPRETSSERPKVVRTWCVLYILTSKCASRHNGVQLFRHRNF